MALAARAAERNDDLLLRVGLQRSGNAEWWAVRPRTLLEACLLADNVLALCERARFSASVLRGLVRARWIDASPARVFCMVRVESATLVLVPLLA